MCQQPHNFLNCTQIKDDIQQAFTSDNITPKQHTLIISFIAAKIIYGNSQRPGVVQNMSIEEYLNKEEGSSGISSSWKQQCAVAQAVELQACNIDGTSGC